MRARLCSSLESNSSMLSYSISLWAYEVGVRPTESIAHPLQCHGALGSYPVSGFSGVGALGRGAGAGAGSLVGTGVGCEGSWAGGAGSGAVGGTYTEGGLAGSAGCAYSGAAGSTFGICCVGRLPWRCGASLMFFPSGVGGLSVGTSGSDGFPG